MDEVRAVYRYAALGKLLTRQPDNVRLLAVLREEPRAVEPEALGALEEPGVELRAGRLIPVPNMVQTIILIP